MFGAVLFLEGALYALMPGRMKRMMQAALTMPETTMRMGGLAAAVIGVGLVWLSRGG